MVLQDKFNNDTKVIHNLESCHLVNFKEGPLVLTSYKTNLIFIRELLQWSNHRFREQQCWAYSRHHEECKYFETIIKLISILRLSVNIIFKLCLRNLRRAVSTDNSLSNYRAELSASCWDSTGGGAIASGENFSWYHKCSYVWAKIFEKSG